LSALLLLQAELAAAQLAEVQWLEAGRITAAQKDEDTQCPDCGEYDGKHTADCGGPPCDICGVVGGHDEDLHAEARLDREADRAWDRAEASE
jgi:hypothetical protein